MGNSLVKLCRYPWRACVIPRRQGEATHICHSAVWHPQRRGLRESHFILLVQPAKRVLAVFRNLAQVGRQGVARSNLRCDAVHNRDIDYRPRFARDCRYREILVSGSQTVILSNAGPGGKASWHLALMCPVILPRLGASQDSIHIGTLSTMTGGFFPRFPGGRAVVGIPIFRPATARPFVAALEIRWPDERRSGRTA